MISIKGLTVAYAHDAVLQDIHLEITPGECVLVTGPSGCGKSTLARVLCGLIPSAIPAQVSGEVRVAGLDTLQEPLHRIAQQVGMVFQRPASQLFHLRVEDEVAFGPRNLGLAETEVKQRVAWALEATGLSALKDDKPFALSGGQKQCVAIASALAMRPQLLVLDEPTASLDVPNTRRVMDTLQALNTQYGITLVLIEHRLAEAAQLASRVILMEDGRIFADGEPHQVFADRELRQRLGLRRPTDEASAAWQALIRSNGRQAHPGQPLLEFQGVSAGFNGQAVIHAIDLALYPGEFTALVGDNGAGKSTLAMVAAGLLKPQAGKVHFANGARPRPGLDVALLFQDPQEQLFTNSVDEEVAFGPRNYNRFDPDLHQAILDGAGLAGLRARRPNALSVGQQQRTALAACLGLKPRLLILDEPTLGQDWGHLQRLMNYLTLLNQAGTSILLISHDYKLVHRYAQRVILLTEGHIERIGYLQSNPVSPLEVKNETHHP